MNPGTVYCRPSTWKMLIVMAARATRAVICEYGENGSRTGNRATWAWPSELSQVRRRAATANPQALCRAGNGSNIVKQFPVAQLLRR